MADEAAAKAARDALEVSRRAAMQLVQGTGAARTNALLGRSAKALKERIRQIAPNLGEDSFTIVQLRATLRQVQQVLREVTLPMLKGAVVDTAAQAAEKAAKGTVDYLVEADRAFRGVGDAPIALRKASMLEVGVHGAKASVLRRLATGVQAVKGKQAGPGILQRYGMETVKHFEQELQVGLVAKKSWNEMSRDITKHSPFLRGSRTGGRIASSARNVWGPRTSPTTKPLRKLASNWGTCSDSLATFDDRTGASSTRSTGRSGASTSPSTLGRTNGTSHRETE